MQIIEPLYSSKIIEIAKGIAKVRYESMNTYESNETSVIPRTKKQKRAREKSKRAKKAKQLNKKQP